MSSPYPDQNHQPYANAQLYPSVSGNRFQSVAGLGWATIVGLGILAFAYLIEAALGVGQLLNPQMTLPDEQGEQVSLWIGLQGVGALLRALLYVATVVLFLVWLYRAYTNLRPALRAERVESSAGWAIGWWFIPFANLVKPFLVVREVWRESDPEFDSTMAFAPRNDGSAPLYMSFWWLFWLTSNFASSAVWRLSDAKFADLDKILGILFFLAGGLSLAAALCAISVVRDISKRQLLRSHALAPLLPYSSYYQPAIQPPVPPVFNG